MAFERVLPMSRVSPLWIVIAVWAAIYLPALGSFEIKGEEGRRILPAITMLESGNYLVPQVGGDAYFRKPPLINWLVAGSFKIFGKQNEWTARVPSVLCILVVAIAFVTIARRTLGVRGSMLAALVWLTNPGTVFKGRLIEIEALYISLCALAMICWFSWWQEKRSPWLTWLVPWIFLGLGWLAKGPTHLLFFYALVLAVLWQTRQWRSLFHPAHFLGVFIMFGIFAAWAVPLMQASDSGKVMNKWSGQLAGRVTGEFFHWYVWVTALPRALCYFLPWLLLAPLIRFNRLRDESDRKLARALAWSVVIPLALMSLVPGAAPRYSLPLLLPFCWLMGMALDQDAFAPPPWMQRLGRPLWARVGVGFVVLALLTGLIYFPVSSVFYKSRHKIKNVADQINAVVPQTETLYAVAPKYQPFFFYMHAPVKYLNTLSELPLETRYFLVKPDNEQEAAALQQWAPRQTRSILRVKDYRKQTVVVFAVDP